MNNLFKFLTGLLDNANFGKIATDLSPGILLTVAGLILLSGRTELEIFPYNKIREYETREIAAVSAAAVARDAVAVARVADPATPPAALTALVNRERLLLARQDSLALQSREARTLRANLAVLSDNFIELFIVGFIVGVLMAQVSGAMLFNLVYEGVFRWFNKNKTLGGLFENTMLGALFENREPSVRPNVKKSLEHRTNAYLALRVKPAYAERLPDISVTHFRYVEVAMNMVLPTAGLAIAIGTLPGAGTWVTVLAWTLGASSLGLGYNGYQCFKGYRLKQWDLRAAMLEELNWLDITPSTPWLPVTPPALPDPAKQALAELLEDKPELGDWKLVFVWTNEETPPGFSVVADKDKTQQVFRVMPTGAKYEVVEVTKG